MEVFSSQEDIRCCTKDAKILRFAAVTKRREEI